MKQKMTVGGCDVLTRRCDSGPAKKEMMLGNYVEQLVGDVQPHDRECNRIALYDVEGWVHELSPLIP